MCAMGAYTRSDHADRNSSIAENFMRSANAPAISAGVMMAKVIWNMAYTDSGTVSPRCDTVSWLEVSPCTNFIPLSSTRSQPPKNGVPGVNAHEYSTSHQSKLTTQVQAKLCMSVASTFFFRTIPP